MGMEKVSAFGRQAKQQAILSGTVTGTGKHEEQKPIEVSQAVEKFGAGEGNRTPDQRLGKPMRYPCATPAPINLPNSVIASLPIESLDEFTNDSVTQ